MKRMSRYVFLMLGMSIMTTASFANQANVQAIPGEYIVKVKDSMLKEFLVQKNLGAEVMRPIPVSYGAFYVVHTSDTKAMVNSDYYEYIEPNYIYQATELRDNPLAYQVAKAFGTVKSEPLTAAIPNDPLFDRLWGLRNTGKNEPDKSGKLSSKVGVAGNDINALKAWGITKGSRAIKIAVIDTGIDYEHPDLKDNVDATLGYNFSADSDDAMDDGSHGSHCAGIIGAVHDNGIGVAGVMGEVTLIPVKFLDGQGSGSTENAIKAIDYATKLNVDVMSNSWGGGGSSKALQEAIQRASAKGIVFVAAAGNDGTSNEQLPQYPASYTVDNVIAVASTTAQEKLSSFSCYGKTRVHVAAPGSNIISTTPNNTYTVMSGTSMATPFVTGIVGLLLEHEGKLSFDEIKKRLINSSVKVSALKGKTQSNGRVDAYAALIGITQ